MRKRQTVRGIHVQRLRQGGTAAAGGGIAHMGDAHLAGKAVHMAWTKNVLDQPVVLAQIQLAVIAGHNAGRVLAAMLQYRQGVIQTQADVPARYNAYQTTHDRFSSSAATAII